MIQSFMEFRVLLRGGVAGPIRGYERQRERGKVVFVAKVHLAA